MRRRTCTCLSLLRLPGLAFALLDTLRTVRGVSMIDCCLFGMVEDCQLRMPPHPVPWDFGACGRGEIYALRTPLKLWNCDVRRKHETAEFVPWRATMLVLGTEHGREWRWWSASS